MELAKIIASFEIVDGIHSAEVFEIAEIDPRCSAFAVRSVDDGKHLVLSGDIRSAHWNNFSPILRLVHPLYPKDVFCEIRAVCRDVNQDLWFRMVFTGVGCDAAVKISPAFPVHSLSYGKRTFI